MLAQNASNRAAYLEEYSYQTKEDQEILHGLHRESSCQGQSEGFKQWRLTSLRIAYSKLKGFQVFNLDFFNVDLFDILSIFLIVSLAFSMATELAMDPEYQLFVSCRCYEAAHELLTSEVLKDQSSDQLPQVLKRLGNIRNEMGVYYMNQAAAMQTDKQGMLSCHTVCLVLANFLNSSI